MNYELKDLLFLLAAFAICVGFGICLHKQWDNRHKPTVTLLDLWGASGAKERAEFANNLCKSSYGEILCQILKHREKCK